MSGMTMMERDDVNRKRCFLSLTATSSEFDMSEKEG